MASAHRPQRARRARWLAFLLGLMVGAALWWFRFHLNRHSSPAARVGFHVGGNDMLHRLPTLLSLLLLTAVPLAAAAATDPVTAHRAAAPVKKPARAKTPVKKPAAQPASPHTAGMIPPAMGAHKPPATASHSHYDVPQAKSLAETPDVVLNSRVRASLMSALTAAKEEDISPETVKGVVTLTGSVKTQALRTRAEQVARKYTECEM
jgi:hypothetical protein